MNENLLEKKNVLKVKNYLQKFDPSIKLIKLNTTARTAQDAANSLKQEVGAIIKSLIFKTNDNDFYLCLVSGDKYMSEKKLASIAKKKITKANAEEVKTQTGFSIGEVSPVAHISQPLHILIDESLKRFDIIFAAAGHPYVVFGITFENLCEITKGEISDIVN